MRTGSIDGRGRSAGRAHPQAPGAGPWRGIATTRRISTSTAVGSARSARARPPPARPAPAGCPPAGAAGRPPDRCPERSWRAAAGSSAAPWRSSVREAPLIVVSGARSSWDRIENSSSTTAAGSCSSGAADDRAVAARPGRTTQPAPHPRREGGWASCGQSRVPSVGISSCAASTVARTSGGVNGRWGRSPEHPWPHCRRMYRVGRTIAREHRMLHVRLRHRPRVSAQSLTWPAGARAGGARHWRSGPAGACMPAGSAVEDSDLAPAHAAGGLGRGDPHRADVLDRLAEAGGQRLPIRGRSRRTCACLGTGRRSSRPRLRGS